MEPRFDLNLLLKEISSQGVNMGWIQRIFFNYGLSPADFTEFNNHYKNTVERILKKSQFKVNYEDLYKVAQLNTKLFFNFCLFQESNKLSMFIHLSDSRDSYNSGDKIFFLGTASPYNIIPQPQATSFVYQTHKLNYYNGLNGQLNNNLGSFNTEVISYRNTDVIKFCIIINALVANESSDIKNLCFDMIRFKSTSIPNEVILAQYYSDNADKISFAVSAEYDDNMESTKKTASYDFGSLHP